MMDFRGKTAIVTGAGSGIGRELALALADRGCKVAVTDIVGERVSEVVEALRRKGVEAAGYRVDHSSLSEVEAFAAAFFTDWSHVDIVCMNAGVGHGGAVEELTIEDWQWVMGINLWGAIYMTQVFVPRMIERKQGSILITASLAGVAPFPPMAPYNTAKFAMVGLAESLRMELGAHNIKVSALCPGFINTNIVKDGKLHIRDREGKDAGESVVHFYAKRGVDPALVARDGLRALSRDVAIMPSTLHAWPTYLIHRLSPTLYTNFARFGYRKRFLFRIFGIK
jgi:NAD(P)-dependent dehydrogenase (short-subunit alcohol dehydrogenase family)